MQQLVHIPIDTLMVEGLMVLPTSPIGLVVFAHGSGSSRHSPRNNLVASVLRERRIGTLLLDLLTPEEELERHRRFDIPVLTQRLLSVTHWLRQQHDTQSLPLAYFGASTGAAAALMAAAVLGNDIQAVVSRGGRPDLAEPLDLARVRCPTLLLVGGLDEGVLLLNRQAASEMHCPHTLSIIPGASHLFEEPGTLNAVALQAADWFEKHLLSAAARP